MPDYKNGKIYCIRSYQTPDIYIGSTVQRLCKRIGSHREKYTKWLNDKHRYTSSFELMKYDDCYIELIKDYPCENKEQLHKKEGEYIREMTCVNRCIPGRTKKQYQQDNSEKIREYKKQYQQQNKKKLAEKQKKYQENNKQKITERGKKYYEKNKEKILEQNKEKITCDCGNIVTKNSLSRHKKTIKHQKFLNN